MKYEKPEQFSKVQIQNMELHFLATVLFMNLLEVLFNETPHQIATTTIASMDYHNNF